MIQKIPKPRLPTDVLSAPVNHPTLIEVSTGKGKIVIANLKVPIIVLDASIDHMHFTDKAVDLKTLQTTKKG